MSTALWFASHSTAFGICGTVPIMQALGPVHDPVPAFLLKLAALLILSGFSSIHWLVKSISVRSA